MTDVPLMYLIGFFVVDSKTFGKLEPGDQEILRAEIASAGQRLDTQARKGNASAVDALSNHGIEFAAPSSEAELERWHQISVEAMARLRETERYSNALLDEMSEHVRAYRAKAEVAPPSTGPAAPAGADASDTP
jgi:TRAP-type C4-dicarboxylate transport system substrate-binding protein